jgi:hypothetical protein
MQRQRPPDLSRNRSPTHVVLRTARYEARDHFIECLTRRVLVQASNTLQIVWTSSNKGKPFPAIARKMFLRKERRFSNKGVGGFT